MIVPSALMSWPVKSVQIEPNGVQQGGKAGTGLRAHKADWNVLPRTKLSNMRQGARASMPYVIQSSTAGTKERTGSDSRNRLGRQYTVPDEVVEEEDNYGDELEEPEYEPSGGEEVDEALVDEEDEDGAEGSGKGKGMKLKRNVSSLYMRAGYGHGRRSDVDWYSRKDRQNPRSRTDRNARHERRSGKRPPAGGGLPLLDVGQSDDEEEVPLHLPCYVSLV